MFGPTNRKWTQFFASSVKCIFNYLQRAISRMISICFKLCLFNNITTGIILVIERNTTLILTLEILSKHCHSTEEMTTNCIQRQQEKTLSRERIHLHRSITLHNICSRWTEKITSTTWLLWFPSTFLCEYKKFIEYELKMKVETRELLTSSSSSTQLMKYLNNSVAVCEYFS